MIRDAFEFIAEAIKSGLEPKPLGDGLWNQQGLILREPLPREIERENRLEVATLAQVAAYVNQAPDEPTPPDGRFLVTVTGTRRVDVGHPLTEEADLGRVRRWVLAAVHPNESRTDSITKSLADTLSWLKSGCEQTADGDELMALLSDVALDEKVKVQDKGAGQRITVERGVGNTEGIEPKRTYELAPFVTFHDVGQPRRPYTMRLHRETLEVTLRCADGGAWRTQVVSDIRAWLGGAIEPGKAIII